MIGKLKGIVDSICSDHIILDVGGVGYIVYIDDKTRAGLQEQDSAQLFIHSITKEDGVYLYGFNNPCKKDWFLELIKISGISGKIAMLILSFLTLGEIRSALVHKNESTFVQIPGIGKKLATRIVNELKNIQITDGNELEKTSEDQGLKTQEIRTETISALINLGIPRGRAIIMTDSAIDSNPTANLEDIIKFALQKK